MGPIFNEFGIFFNYLATGDKVRTIGDLCCICKRFISIKFFFFYVLNVHHITRLKEPLKVKGYRMIDMVMG